MTTIGTFPGNDAERGDLAVLSELRKHGSDLTQPTNVIYYSYIPAERDARSAAEALCHRGFYAMVSEPLGVLSDGTRSDDFCVIALAKATPTSAYFRSMRSIFDKLARQYGGTYDGWEAAIVKTGDRSVPDDNAKNVIDGALCTPVSRVGIISPERILEGGT
jgi:hypothetical protein